MPLNDIWRKLNSQFAEAEMGFYTMETFGKVPTKPGVYAWFYPLRIHTKDIDEYVKTINLILDYDSTSLGNPESIKDLKFNWDILSIKATMSTKPVDLTSYKLTWNNICSDDSNFKKLTETMMRASLFLPPLYVGKATNLNTRCQQHIKGVGSKDVNDFHNRFQDYSLKNKLPIKKISDLLFVCLKTNESNEESNRTEELVEALLKNFSKPKYSKQ